ncbi:hypothetical protein [Pendulispora albinea]|uniref:Lipoprotein n=1 Tax=Pendulispora albinea TaxID=2741071 RepID=A0ABZ2LZM9_9BACT
MKRNSYLVLFQLFAATSMTGALATGCLQHDPQPDSGSLEGSADSVRLTAGTSLLNCASCHNFDFALPASPSGPSAGPHVASSEGSSEPETGREATATAMSRDFSVGASSELPVDEADGP